MSVRACGRYTRENAGMSNEKYERNIFTESPRVPGEGLSAQGKAGTKVKTDKFSRCITGC